MKILLITPVFYGCENKIKSLLEESGHKIFWIENKNLTLDYHGTNSKFKFFRRFYFFLFSPQQRYFKKQLKTIEDHCFDILFSINAHTICSSLVKYLKKQNPDLYSILYLWDSFSMYSWTNELAYFNRVLTFDPEDSKKHNIEYKPNFYIIKNQQNIICDECDLFFAGKFSLFRLNVIDKIINQVKDSSVKYYIKLWPAYKIFSHSYLLYIIIQKFNFNSSWMRNYVLNYEAVEGIIKREYLIVNSLSYEEMQNHLLCSNVILDLHFQGQTGYSHRLIEALANGKKVITSNSNIKKEKFFNPLQIHIMDIQNPVVDCNWIKEKSTFPVDNYFLNLELSTWLKSIINVEIT